MNQRKEAENMTYSLFWFLRIQVEIMIYENIHYHTREDINNKEIKEKLWSLEIH